MIKIKGVKNQIKGLQGKILRIRGVRILTTFYLSGMLMAVLTGVAMYPIVGVILGIFFTVVTVKIGKMEWKRLREDNPEEVRYKEVIEIISKIRENITYYDKTGVYTGQGEVKRDELSQEVLPLLIELVGRVKDGEEYKELFRMYEEPLGTVRKLYGNQIGGRGEVGEEYLYAGAEVIDRFVEDITKVYREVEENESNRLMDEERLNLGKLQAEVKTLDDFRGYREKLRSPVVGEYSAEKDIQRTIDKMKSLRYGDEIYSKDYRMFRGKLSEVMDERVKEGNKTGILLMTGFGTEEYFRRVMRDTLVTSKYRLTIHSENILKFELRE